MTDCNTDQGNPSNSLDPAIISMGKNKSDENAAVWNTKLYFSFNSYNFGVLTGLLLMPSFQQDMRITTDTINSALISTLMAGAFVGAIVSGPLADTIGRKALMALGTIIFIFGNVLQVGSNDLNTMYGGRGVTGISLG